MARPPSIFKALTWAYQQQIITYALVRCEGDVQQAANFLGIDDMTLRRHQAPLAEQSEGGRKEGSDGGGDL